MSPHAWANVRARWSAGMTPALHAKSERHQRRYRRAYLKGRDRCASQKRRARGIDRLRRAYRRKGRR